MTSLNTLALGVALLCFPPLMAQTYEKDAIKARQLYADGFNRASADQDLRYMEVAVEGPKNLYLVVYKLDPMTEKRVPWTKFDVDEDMKAWSRVVHMRESGFTRVLFRNPNGSLYASMRVKPLD